MIIAVSNLKGGTGKTTTSILLAAALTAAGHDCIVIDADPQGSATDWADIAQENNTPLPFTITVANARSLKRLPANNTIYIVDCPPGHATIIDAAISVADHIIVPVSPSAIDVDRMWDTLQLIGDKPATTLLTAARLGTTNLDELRTMLAEAQVPTFRTPILQREAIKKLYGTNPTVFFGYNCVAKELLNNEG